MKVILPNPLRGIWDYYRYVHDYSTFVYLAKNYHISLICLVTAGRRKPLKDPVHHVDPVDLINLNRINLIFLMVSFEINSGHRQPQHQGMHGH